MSYIVGVDIGSRTSKAVLTRDGKLVTAHILPSGTNYRTAATRLIRELLAKAGVSASDVARTAATGHGARNVQSAPEVSEIRACARGINRLFPTVRTVIDVQGQLSQVIRITGSGQVVNFVASEKCAAGSGRFLEVIANVLQVRLEDIGPLSLKSRHPVAFTTSCAVFGESEAISRVAEGAAKEDILAGVHEALASKISALVSRVGLEMDAAVTGGGALDTGLVQRLEEKLKIHLLVPEQPQIVNALGAAILAGESELSEKAVERPENLGGEL